MAPSSSLAVAVGATSHSGRSSTRKRSGGGIQARSPSNATLTWTGRQLAGSTTISEQARLMTAASRSSWPMAACQTVRAVAQRPCGLSSSTARWSPSATSRAWGMPSRPSCSGLLPTNSVEAKNSSCTSVSAPRWARSDTRQRRADEGRRKLQTAETIATQRERPKRRDAISRCSSRRGYSPTAAFTRNMLSFTQPTRTGRSSPSRSARRMSSAAWARSSDRLCSRAK
ncbi:hypothetical protein [Paracidovorax citrulli]|uniref:hypothetical protein n=1 Tax=Paracidovorax citrulli TaxID=80869 RepID=UPI003EB831CA